MHELAVCESLLSQVRTLAAERGAESVGTITVRIGPLSGVEPELLIQAFSIARAGRHTGQARLEIESVAIELRCRDCGAESGAIPNRMLCSNCSSWRVDLIHGDEMLLASVELHLGRSDSNDAQSPDPGDASDV
ncbi:MAG: hydrogenase maturation nickel metallochaperone HypA [Gammaproteobacteria bacterium]|nr:hydrogenase maturation nickel metallochaperone HypA [Gammaproteobacteria bacterium]